MRAAELAFVLAKYLAKDKKDERLVAS